MKITNVSIENFMAIGKAEFSLDSQGLVLIQGENNDDSSAISNGAGKSSLPDAISWCLFGATARDVKGDKVVNRRAKKDTRVEVTLLDGDDCYVIVRYRKHSKGKNRLHVEHTVLGGASRDLTKGTDKETQDVIVGIMGCSHDVFRAAVYAAQGQMPDLPGATDKVLKMLVEEAAGIDVIERAYGIARERLREAIASGEAFEALIERTDERMDLLEDEISRHKASKDAWEGERQHDIKTLTNEAKGHIEMAKKAKAEFEKDKPPIEADLEKVEAEIAAVGAERDKERELDKAATTLENDARNAEREFINQREMVLGLKNDMEILDEKVGTPCKTCGKPIEEKDIDDQRRRLKETIKADALEAKRLKQAFEDASESAKNARTAHGEHVSSMTDLTDALARQSALKRALEAVESVERHYEAHREDAKRAAAHLEKVKTAKNPHAENLKAAEEKLKSLAAEREKVVEDAKASQQRTKIAQNAVNVFGPAGVRAQILDTVTPYLNARTAHYLAALSDGNIEATWSTISMTAKKEMREKFEIAVTSATGGDTFNGLSGGEQRKVRLACALALQDLVASRATKPIDLWMGDEIDDALDNAGLERLMTILDEKARERGTVLVISHADLKDWIRDVWTMRKKGEKSELVVA